MEARDVGPSEPHVADEDEAERVFRVLSALLDGLAADPRHEVPCLAPLFGVVREVPRHHHLDDARVGVVPLGAQADDLVVEADANPRLMQTTIALPKTTRGPVRSS